MKRQKPEANPFNLLSRRDFIKLCGTSSAGLLLAACGYLPTTATRSQLFTLAPTPSQIGTPSPTPHLTDSPPLTERPSRTPEPTQTETLTPTETFKPSFEWQSDFDKKGFANFYGGKKVGADYKLMDDPTGANLGKVYYAYHEGPAVMENGELLIRGYPDVWFPYKKPQFQVEILLFLPEDPLPRISIPSKPQWFLAWGNFDKAKALGDSAYRNNSSVLIVPDGNRYVVDARAFDVQHNSVSKPHDRNLSKRPEFKIKTWHKITWFEDEEIATVLLDDNKCLTIDIPLPGTCGGHGPLYGGDFQKVSVLVRSINIKSWG